MASVLSILTLLTALGGFVTHGRGPLDTSALIVPPGRGALMDSVTSGPALPLLDLERSLLVQCRLPRIRVKDFASEVESDPTEDIRDGQLESLALWFRLTSLRSLVPALDPVASAPGRPSFLCLCRFLC